MFDNSSKRIFVKSFSKICINIIQVLILLIKVLLKHRNNYLTLSKNEF